MLVIVLVLAAATVLAVAGYAGLGWRRQWLPQALRVIAPRSDVAVINEHEDEPYKSPYFKLVCPNPNIYYVLNIAGFLQNIPIYNDVEEALHSFAGQSI